MEYVRVTYGVPAKRGGRVIYSGDGTRRLGTIKSADGGYINVLLDGHRYTSRLHPTWKVEYCKAQSESAKESQDNG